jgi:hypothetical protein
LSLRTHKSSLGSEKKADMENGPTTLISHLNDPHTEAFLLTEEDDRVEKLVTQQISPLDIQVAIPPFEAIDESPKS